MTGPRPLTAEGESAASARPLPEALGPAFDLADAWAGGAIAILVGGSHGSGAAVWARLDGRAVSLSDLDLYAIVSGRAAQAAAVARARAGRPGLRARRLGWGLAAPLEVAFPTPEDLERLPARPGTLDLARAARVVRGDPSWAARVPRWTPADVDPEEIRLLHENRAFELLLAWPGADGTPLERLLARHAVLKCALDTARGAALAAGLDPPGAEALAAWHAGAAPGSSLGPVLDAAARWRSSEPCAPAPAEARAEWLAVARAWVARWRSIAGDGPGAVLGAARRARPRRRLRCALAWPAASGAGPSLAARLRHARDGTPAHRVNAAAAALLIEAAEAPWAAGAPALAPRARRTLARLGVPGAAAPDWPAAAAAVARAWDLWVLDGQRTEPA